MVSKSSGNIFAKGRAKLGISHILVKPDLYCLRSLSSNHIVLKLVYIYLNGVY